MESSHQSCVQAEEATAASKIESRFVTFYETELCSIVLLLFNPRGLVGKATENKRRGKRGGVRGAAYRVERW